MVNERYCNLFIRWISYEFNVKTMPAFEIQKESHTITTEPYWKLKAISPKLLLIYRYVQSYFNILLIYRYMQSYFNILLTSAHVFLWHITVCWQRFAVCVFVSCYSTFKSSKSKPFFFETDLLIYLPSIQRADRFRIILIAVVLKYITTVEVSFNHYNKTTR